MSADSECFHPCLRARRICWHPCVVVVKWYIDDEVHHAGPTAKLSQIQQLFTNSTAVAFTVTVSAYELWKISNVSALFCRSRSGCCHRWKGKYGDGCRPGGNTIPAGSWKGSRKCCEKGVVPLLIMIVINDDEDEIMTLPMIELPGMGLHLGQITAFVVVVAVIEPG